MAVITANLHILVPLAAAGFFMAMVAFVSIEEALGKN
jgi:hypothetical protein